jgi:hypothetical protein
MFGFTPFAKAPFAALGVGYVVSLSENITVNNAQTITAQFAASQTENVGIADVRTILANLNITRTENTNISDIISGGISSSVSIIEPTTLNNAQSILAQFNFSITEAWGQTPYSVSEKASFATFSFGGAPIAGSLDTNGYNENPKYIVTASSLRAITENLAIQDIPAIAAQFINNIIENLTSNDSSTQTSAFLQTITERVSTLDTPSAVANFIQSIVETSNFFDPIYIFIIDLIDLAILEDNRQSYVDMYVYEALTKVDESSIINVTEYNDIQVYAELGEIGLT